MMAVVVKLKETCSVELKGRCACQVGDEDIVVEGSHGAMDRRGLWILATAAATNRLQAQPAACCFMQQNITLLQASKMAAEGLDG